MSVANPLVNPSQHQTGQPSNTNAPEPRQLLIPADSEVLVRQRYKEDYGPFQAIGPLSIHPLSPPDIFDLLARASGSALKAFNTLKHSRKSDIGLCNYRLDPKTTKSERVIFNRATRELLKLGIIKRIPVKNDYVKVRKSTFMMNPILIKPRKYSEACTLWLRL